MKLGKGPAPPNPKSGVCRGWESRQCGITLSSGEAVQGTLFGVFVGSQGFPIPQFPAPNTLRNRSSAHHLLHVEATKKKPF